MILAIHQKDESSTRKVEFVRRKRNIQGGHALRSSAPSENPDLPFFRLSLLHRTWERHSWMRYLLFVTQLEIVLFGTSSSSFEG